MEHVRALGIKFVSTLAILYIILGLFLGMTFGEVFWISLILGTVSYLVGDLFILPGTSNITATFADFGLALMVIWFLSAIMTMDGNLFIRSVTASIGVALFEYAFHSYVANHILMNRQTNQRQQRNVQYRTEASEELTPKHIDIKDEKQ